MEHRHISDTSPKVDDLIAHETRWHQEMATLRAILLDFPFSEALKWRLPCYTLDGQNVVIIQRFKEYVALLFIKGALLDDPYGILTAPGKHTQSGRQLRFSSAAQIQEQESIIKAYVQQAIGVEKAGLKVELKSTDDYAVPQEFQTRLDDDPELKAAFEALTPGRQRAYLLHFCGAKQTKTRAARVEKHIARILQGKGLQDE